MARWCSARGLFGLLALVSLVVWCNGGYIITTPRKWASGEKAQVCLFSLGDQPQPAAGVVDAPAQTVQLHVTSSSGGGNNSIVPPRYISLPPGKTETCENVILPRISSRSGKLTLSGYLGGQRVEHNETINFVNDAAETFVQTDKYLYMPGQKVQFRVLSIIGPYLKVFYGQYPEMWIESPSGSRIAQWINVDGSGGLIHEEFQLISEPEEGTYKIHVESPVGGPKAVQEFKVEEFVLPRFEVTIEPPPYILGTDTELSYKVCSTYTYGQPVKGMVAFRIEAKDYSNSERLMFPEKEISGCEVFSISPATFNISAGRRLANTVSVWTKVTEQGTGQEIEATNTISVERNALKFKHVGTEEYVKPNLPYSGKFKANLPSGAPAVNEEVRVCEGSDCKTLRTDDRGFVEYAYPTYKDLTIKITAPRFPAIMSEVSRWQHVMFKSEESHTAKKYHSPSNSSLIIKAPARVQLKCSAGEKQQFEVPVMYSATQGTTAQLSYQLISRGQIQYTNTIEHTFTSSDLPIDTTQLLSPLSPPLPGTVRGVINIPIIVPLTSSPTAKVVVWYTREDGEVVSDAKEINIKKCLTNQVKLKWSKERAEPGEKVNLTVTAQPASLCSLGVVDKSVELLSSGKDSLTLNDVFEVAENAMVGDKDNTQIENDNEYCKKNYKEEPEPTLPPIIGPPPRPLPLARARRSIWRPPRSYYTSEVDAIRMFEKSGLFVFTDQKVETRPCHYRDPYYYDYDYPVMFMFAAPRPKSDYVDNLVDDAMYDAPVAMASEVIPVVAEPPRVASTRVTSPPPSSTTKTRAYFPETWLWSLHSTDVKKGNATQTLELPHTVTEWVGKAVCVHPEAGIGLSKKEAIVTFTPFFIDLTLPPSVQRGEILPVKISVFNYLDGALPVRVVLSESPEYEILDDPLATPDLPSGSKSSCIGAQEKAVHTVRIRPNVVGDVNLTVEAYVDELYPEVCGSEYVISKRDRIIKPIRVELEGFPQEKTWTKYMCTDAGNEELVSWSLGAPQDIVPDSTRGWVTAVGDLLGPTLDNLGSLVKMPYGCGEQNMVNFAPNIFVMQYLEASERTTPEIAEKAIEFMKSGYQRELRYQHKDGSFSAFGQSDDSGSTWLTAFVLKSFAQAQPFIAIDNNDIEMSRDWLKLSQMENGCFLSKGKVFHKAMKGGIAGNDSPVPLTAYVLTALLEAGEPTTSQAVSEAAFCLASDTSTDPYTLALKTYALALAGANETAAFLTQLLGMAKESPDGLYWEMPAKDGKSAAAGVETASYAVLAMASHSPAADYLDRMQLAVKWISSNRNGQGGFVSTQDTVVALQSLAKFEIVLGNKPVNVAVLVSSEGLENTFRIDDTNKLLLQRQDLPVFPTVVTADVAGEGCALVQAVLRYNTYEEEPSTAFTLTTTTETAPDDTCVTKRIKTCASYTLPDLKSNMAVIEINLVSGYIPDKKDLKQAVGYGTGLIKRYEVDGRKVTFYIDEFSAEELCVGFKVMRQVDVENPKAGSVRVYDYYDPDQFVSTTYTFPPPDECVSGMEIAADIEGLIIPDVVIDDVVLPDTP